MPTPSIGPPAELLTPRLRLRRPRPADAAAVFERWAQDPEVTRYLIWRPHREMAETEAHITRCLEGWASGSEYVWLIEERGGARLLGSLSARVQGHRVNVGYLLARDAWGRGFMVEALEAVAAWFLAQPAVSRVWATCDIDNHASARVLEKAGFEFEGILRQWDAHPNQDQVARDSRCYSRVRPRPHPPAG